MSERDKLKTTKRIFILFLPVDGIIHKESLNV